MWPVLTILLGAALGILHAWWRRRFARQAEAGRQEIATLQHQQAELELRSRAHQEALFNSMVEGVLLLDHQARIELANQAFHRLFGLPGEIRGRLLIEAVRSHELTALLDHLARESVVRGFEFQLAGREELSLEVNAARLREPSGAESGYLLVFHNLTRLKQLERTREEFVANVSHELRTPLSHIKGYAESLLAGAQDDPTTREKFLRTIERNADRLTLLIEDLLTISELESGRSRLTLQPVDARTVATEVLDEFQARAAARQVTLTCTMAPLVVSADADRLRQVLSNLVDNAIKYGRPAGQVRVGGHPVPDGRAELFVQDDGPGLPPEAASRVFERFYRVDQSRSREQGGTGLGLSIVKHIVQSHGGQVWVESEPNCGAKFCFTLPTCAPEG